VKPRIPQLLSAWLPPGVHCLLIFIASSRSSLPGMNGFAHQDKLFHGLAYALMGALFYRALKITLPARFSGMAVALSIGMATLYGLSDELHQLFVPGRTADAGDLAADFLGSLVGVLLTRRYELSRRTGNTAIPGLTKGRRSDKETS
jgi:VanZ family protein